MTCRLIWDWFLCLGTMLILTAINYSLEKVGSDLLTGHINGKNNRRLDDCLRYCIVAGKKALEDVDLGGNKLYKVCV